MLKAVDNPNIAQLGQGVMVTPEGGYVVAQPDSWVVSRSMIMQSFNSRIRSERPGKNKLLVPKA
jgi:protein MPE1